ncbi:MAG: MFS transporter [Microbacterium sp.]|uniref:MFS transporter n=1 Tax=Microbacterium sp. TaxID=51671 RepID=UPI0039E3871A
MSPSHGAKSSLLSQPSAVWAVAFACVISFMGIGLVDPILPALAEGLKASPADVSLLFTSYLVVTAVAMLGVGWVSSRIGSKLSLIVGLALIVVFAALAGAAGDVAGVIGFRGGWGLGNALFIATSLAVIVASAQGGFGGAIILYEAALGIGIATGPLLGGILGSISWRGPFFGVSVLMAIALVATLLFVPSIPKPRERISLAAPIKALRHRGLATMGAVALLYNWGFFTMLGYAPYPMHLEAMQLGLVFTAWGLLVAVFAVFLAPWLQRRFGTVAVLYANLAGLAVVMAVIAFGIGSPATVVAAVIVSGAFIGINNTLTTQAVMLVAPVERSVASSAYGFVRFIGGGLAPFAAGKIAEATNESMSFLVGAIAFVIAIPVLATGHKLVAQAEREAGAEAETVATSAIEIVHPTGSSSVQPVVVAVGSRSSAGAVVDEAATIALRLGAPLEIVHVRITTIIQELAVTPESEEDAEEEVRRQVLRLDGSDLVVRGMLLHSVGDRAATAAALAKHAQQVDASTFVIGRAGGDYLAKHLLAAFEGAPQNLVLVESDWVDTPGK